MQIKTTTIVLAVLILFGCDNQKNNSQTDRIPFVKTTILALAPQNIMSLSGVVRARHDIPISFQVSGRIVERSVDAGQLVTKGDPLFKLDSRDMIEVVQVGQANLRAAQARLITSRVDAERKQKMQAENLISVQTLDRAQLREREASTRVDVAKATLAQAENSLSYSQLLAPVSGVLIEVSGEAGQVVTAGHSVAVIAKQGAREVELSFANAVKPPRLGRLLISNELTLPIQLREVSGAVDPRSRTWRARYAITQGGDMLALGSVVSAVFKLRTDDKPSFEVPITALDERGDGSILWQVINGTAQPINVHVLNIDTEAARVNANLKEGDSIIALGTHLLTPNMAVKALVR